MKYIDPTGMAYDDYFNFQGKYLGTDNSATDNVRVIDEGQYNLNKEPDGSIDPIMGTSMSMLHSQSGITTDASLTIYGHYDPTGLKLTSAQPGQFSSGGGMEVKTKNGILSNIDVDVAGFDRSGVADHSSEIKNIFVHENKHVTDYKTWGLITYNATPQAIIEQRAIMTQMGDPTFSQMRPAMQNAVRAYGEKFGMSFDMKPPISVLPTTPITVKSIEIKLK
jgi:hypothetical protein